MTIKNKQGIDNTHQRIEIESDISANLIFSGLNIDVSEEVNCDAFKIADDSNADIEITLKDGTKNSLSSGYECAGLQKNGNYGTLVIQVDNESNGYLTATGGDYGAGIGGGRGGSASNISISGGTITATGG